METSLEVGDVPKSARVHASRDQPRLLSWHGKDLVLRIVDTNFG